MSVAFFGADEANTAQEEIQIACIPRVLTHGIIRKIEKGWLADFLKKLSDDNSGAESVELDYNEESDHWTYRVSKRPKPEITNTDQFESLSTGIQQNTHLPTNSLSQKITVRC